MLKNTINKVLQTILPSKMYLNLLTWKRGYEEPEIKLVYDLCDKSLISIDVGAANALYLAHIFGISKKCWAFEPRKDAIENLKKMFAGITTAIQFENVALSNITGFADFKIMKDRGGLSTLECDNMIEKYGEIEIVKVPVKRLDDYDFSDKVGFIKIDVEGHEESVLLGAINLLERDHPSLLIEIEERHKPNSLNNVKDLLIKMGYLAFFYLNDQLESIDNYDPKKYHNYGIEGEKYVFNFLFVYKDSLFRIDHLLKAS